MVIFILQYSSNPNTFWIIFGGWLSRCWLSFWVQINAAGLWITVLLLLSTVCSQWSMSDEDVLFQVLKWVLNHENSNLGGEYHQLSQELWKTGPPLDELYWNPTKLHNSLKPLYGSSVFSFFSLSTTCMLLCEVILKTLIFEPITELLWYGKNSSWFKMCCSSWFLLKILCRKMVDLVRSHSVFVQSPLTGSRCGLP